MAHYFTIMNSTGTCLWRVYPIHKALEEEGHQATAINMPQMSDRQMDIMVEWADVITFQMVAAKPLLKKAKAKGVYTIFDCDDFIDEVPEKHPQVEVTNDQEYQVLFRHTMRNVDMVTVSSPVLYEKYKKYNKNTVLLPNYLPHTFWERPYLPNTASKQRIGWAGGVSHTEDLEFIAPVVKSIMREYPSTKFVYVGGGGWNTMLPTTHRYGEDVFADIPYQRKEYSPGERVELWPDKLNSLRLDVALAPLTENSFSQCKTPIKYFEYAINHWAGVYQKFLYQDVVKHGVTGFLATTEDEWLKYIRMLLNDAELRRTIGENAYRDIKDHQTFYGNREQWLEVYRRAGTASTRENSSFYVSE